MNANTVIVGLIGGPGSGKTTVAEFLQTHDFTPFKFSEIIREELIKQNISNPTRQQLQDMGDSLRSRFGRDYLAKKVWEKVLTAGKERVVLDGFRNPGDMEPFNGSSMQFITFALIANPKIRFKRILAKGSKKDPATFEEFLKNDQRDRGEGEAEYGQNTLGCIELADYKINAEEEKEEVFKQIVKVLETEGII